MFAGDAPQVEESHIASTCSMVLRHVKLNFRQRRAPGKSSAEYQADYRKRLKDDPEKWEAYLRKQREHSKKYVQHRSEEKKQAARERNKLHQRERREKMKMAQRTLSTKDQKTTPVRTTRAKVASQQMSQSKQREYWRERQRTRRAQLTEEQKEAVRTSSRQRYALKKLAGKSHHAVQTDSPPGCDAAPECGNEENNHDDTPTKTPTMPAKYNALHRVKKAMPKSSKTTLYVLKQLIKKASPRKKCVLQEILYNEFDSSITDSAVRDVKKSRKRQTKDSVVKDKIVKFYFEMSVDLPGKRHYSIRLKKQKKILTHPISMLYSNFIRDYPEIKVSKRTFYRCRPRHIMTMKNHKFIQCLCEYCENCRLKLNVLKSCGAPITTVNDALDATLCPKRGKWWMPQCVSRKCDKCGIQSLKDTLVDQCDPIVSVTVKEWKMIYHEKYKVKRMELIEETYSLLVLIDLFVNELKGLSSHIFTSEWQRDQFKLVKNDIPPDTAVVVIDFAENYTCRHQREVAAVHWSYNQCTLHPVVVYKKCSLCNQNMTCYHMFVSDDLNHDSNFVFHVLKQVLSDTNTSRFIIFSDNCGVQYKSKLPFYHLSQLANEFSFERCFFGERHGKSECDSSGGMVKSFLTQAVTSGRAVLRNANEIVCFLNSALSIKNVNCSHQSRTFHLVEESSIDRSISSSTLKTLPGTKKVHSLRVLSSQVLAVRQFSCFCIPCLSKNSSQCTNREIISQFENVKWPNAKSDCGSVVDDGEGAYVLTDNMTATVDASGDNRANCADDLVQIGNAENDDVLCNNDSLNDAGTAGLDDICLAECREDVHLADKTVETQVSDLVSAAVAKNISNVLVEDGSSEFSVYDGASKFSAHDSADIDECDTEVGVLDTAMYEPKEKHFKKKIMKLVKRRLFGSKVKSREEFFADMNAKLLACSSFQDVKNLCHELIVHIEKYEIQVQNSTISDIRVEVDKTAMQLLPPNKPLGYLPALTVGDGNCMTRSLSRIVFGHENYHVEMRCRIIAELALNKSRYLDEEYVSVGCTLEKKKVLPMIALLSDCHEEGDTSSAAVIEEIYDRETYKARQLSEYLGIWQLLAASNVLNCAIISLYPQKGPKKYQGLFGRALIPHDMDYDKVIYVMWSSSRPMTQEYWVANHVVPMLKIHK